MVKCSREDGRGGRDEVSEELGAREDGRKRSAERPVSFASSIDATCLAHVSRNTTTLDLSHYYLSSGSSSSSPPFTLCTTFLKYLGGTTPSIPEVSRTLFVDVYTLIESLKGTRSARRSRRQATGRTGEESRDVQVDEEIR